MPPMRWILLVAVAAAVACKQRSEVREAWFGIDRNQASCHQSNWEGTATCVDRGQLFTCLRGDLQNWQCAPVAPAGKAER